MPKAPWAAVALPLLDAEMVTMVCGTLTLVVWPLAVVVKTTLTPGFWVTTTEAPEVAAKGLETPILLNGPANSGGKLKTGENRNVFSRFSPTLGLMRPLNRGINEATAL